jgi:hypothetical protein
MSEQEKAILELGPRRVLESEIDDLRKYIGVDADLDALISAQIAKMQGIIRKLCPSPNIGE